MNDLENKVFPNLPQGIIFDCDGVVTDSWEWSNHFYNTIRQRLGLPLLTPDEKTWVFAATIRSALEYLFPASRLEEAIDQARTFSLEDALPHIKATPGVELFLKYINGLGILSAVNTNGGRENALILESLNLAGYFSTIITADDVSQAKPHPAGAQLILETWGLPGSQTVYIGDSSIDQETAAAAGLSFWAFRNPRLEAEFHFNDFARFTAFLNGE